MSVSPPFATPLVQMSASDRDALRQRAQADYQAAIDRTLGLDLTRGKPSSEQLDLADAMLTLPRSTKDAQGVDVRNYGGLQGLPELRAIFAELLGVELEQIIAQGNSSLALMKEVLVNFLLFGGVTSPQPWSKEKKITFLCPVPGYDRHFALTESLGFELVSVPSDENGPDMDAVEKLVAQDASIKGIWLVPTYSNPTGVTLSGEVAARLAAMPTAAPDFVIMWDNAYAVHHLTEHETKTADILSVCSVSGNPHRAFVFASTSKITYAGAGVSFLASSAENIAWFCQHLGFGSIGPDKVNHLRHAEFFGSAQGVREHMRKHTAILAPKFAAVDRVLSERLGGLEVATWNNPEGGYFVNLDVLPGTASRVVALAKEAGLALTPAGASFPYGKDPADANIRLAPSLPPLAEVEAAMELVATCVILAATE